MRLGLSVDDLACIFIPKVVLSFSKGCLMIFNKEDVQNEMKRNGNLYRAWSGAGLGFMVSLLFLRLPGN